MLHALTTGDAVERRSDPPGARLLPAPWAAVLAVCSGAILVPAFPPAGWWPLACLGVAGLTVATRGRTARFGALLGTLTGLTFFLAHLHWSGVYVGALPWVALAVLQTVFVTALGALLPGVWLAHDALLAHGAPPHGERDGAPLPTPARAVLAALAVVAGTAGLWVAQEALRTRVPFGGFPWGRLAFSQSDGPLARWAWLGGAPLTSAAVAVAGGAVAVLVIASAHALRGRRPPVERPDDRRSTRARRLAEPLAALACLTVVPLAYAVPVASAHAASDDTVRVAAIQGDVPEAGLEFNAERRAVLDNHVRGTEELAAQVADGRAEQPDLVFWPENASDIDPLRNPDAAAVISRAADAIGAPILVGAVLREPVGYLSNAGIVWNPGTSDHPGPGVRYVKKHPAPFAEYIPARSFFRLFSKKVDLVRTDFAPGHLNGALPMGGTTVGDVICFEVAYDGIVQQSVRDGAALLAVQTNNATFGYTDESVQQLAMSRLRAIETGRAVVHISTVGVSAIYGPDGAQLARSGHFTPEVLQATVPLRTGLTPAVRLGVVPEAMIALLGLAIAIGGVLVTRRSRQRSDRASMQT